MPSQRRSSLKGSILFPEFKKFPQFIWNFRKILMSVLRQNQQSFPGFDPIERCHLLFGKYDRVLETNGHYDFCFDVFGQILNVDVIKQSEKLVFIFVQRIAISEPVSEFIEGTDITSCSICCSVIRQNVSWFDKNGSNCLTFKRATKYSSWKKVIFF